jgi:hypothetical protein
VISIPAARESPRGGARLQFLLNDLLQSAWLGHVNSFNSRINSEEYAVLDSTLLRAWEIAGESGSNRPIAILPAQRMSFPKCSQLFFIAARRSVFASSNRDSFSAEKLSSVAGLSGAGEGFGDCNGRF